VPVYGVVTIDTIYMKSNFHNKLQILATNISFLFDEQYNELIKIQSTRIDQGLIKCVCKSKNQNKNVFTLKIIFYAFQNITFLQHFIIRI
jgi:hypothetical protein